LSASSRDERNPSISTPKLTSPKKGCSRLSGAGLATCSSASLFARGTAAEASAMYDEEDFVVDRREAAEEIRLSLDRDGRRREGRTLREKTLPEEEEGERTVRDLLDEPEEEWEEVEEAEGETEVWVVGRRPRDLEGVEVKGACCCWRCCCGKGREGAEKERVPLSSNMSGCQARERRER
jgi:hypothetical protein